jgi:subtilisin family serine protease
MPITFAFVVSTALIITQPIAVRGGPVAMPPIGGFTEVAGEREFSGELIVRAKPTLDSRARARAMAALGTFPKRHNPKTDEFVLAVGIGPVLPGVAENTLAAQLMATGLFQYACPNWLVYPVATPNDPRYPEQWHHTMMQSPLAWDIHRADGAVEVIVAVTDTGIVPHEDLLNRVPGFNSATDLAEVDGGDLTDINGHGTHVAGCAAAAGNNSVGVSGMGWNLRIMPIRVSTAANGGASYEDLLQGVQWAAENGAKVISTSYSGIGFPPIETTGEYVRSLDATLMWAAGNSSTNHAGWDFEHVVVVGASDQSDQRAWFSSYGLGVDLFAPGVGILSSTRDGGYGFASGTSMATPVANGALALVRSANPALSAEHAEHLLFNSCDFWADSANNELWGWGRINLRRAVEFALAAQSPQPPVARDDRAGAIAGLAVELDVLANDFDANMDALEIQSFSQTTSAGRAVTLIEGSGGARDRLRIEDVGPAAGTQTLSYTLVEPLSGATSTATAVVDTVVARAADNPIGAGNALEARYYALVNPTVLPDFSQLLSYASNLVVNLNYPSTNDNFGDSGRADNVGAVYTGWIDIPTTGLWTLSTTSDDGSKLWIGDDLVVNNDGLHGMATASGSRALAAGKHALRVEFFEAGGGAGLLMSWSGPGFGTQIVPGSRLFHGGSVEPADLNRDGAVNSQDLAVLLNAWGASGSAADLNGDGTVGAPDLAILLSRWTG